MDSAARILEVLDRACNAYTFPMLDNGYVYLAATRLALFRSAEDWAMTIEVFGFSPRAGLPDVNVVTFGSRIESGRTRDDFVSEEAYRNHLAQHPHDASFFFHPIEEGDWQDPDDSLLVTPHATEVVVRGRRIALPSPKDYGVHGIELEDPPQVMTFELCRWLAATARNDVLATVEERRSGVRPEMEQLLQLEAWNHPDVVDDARPSGAATFQQLARVLETGDVGLYQPTAPDNTHWSHWPEGGLL